MSTKKVKWKLKNKNTPFEDEAELGSDDEEKDEIRKEIDKNSFEENEDDLDKDLEGFIDREFGQNDNEEINIENEILARKKF